MNLRNLRLGALALSCLAVLAVGGVALAAGTKTNTLTGNSVGDPNNAMSLQVTVKKGKAKTVSKVNAQNFNYACDDETTTGEQSYSFPGKFKVKKVAGQYVFGGTSADTADPYWRVSGSLNKSGTTGYVETYYRFKAGNFYCGGNGGANIKK